MLNYASRFISATRVDRHVIQSVTDGKWLCTSKGGMDVLISTDHSKPAIRPGQIILMALGSCASDDVKIEVEKTGHKVKGISADIIGKFSEKPPRYIKDIEIKFTLDTDASQEKINQIAESVIENICPVASTITGKPALKCRATIKH